jgi:glutamate-1-semialdehyde 2,1-aminomutase
MSGFQDIADEFNIPMVTTVRGSMFGFFFSTKDVNNFEDALENNSNRFASFHQGMLEGGVYLACSAYETGFISTETSDDMIDETLKVAKEVMRNL